MLPIGSPVNVSPIVINSKGQPFTAPKVLDLLSSILLRSIHPSAMNDTTWLYKSVTLIIRCPQKLCCPLYDKCLSQLYDKERQPRKQSGPNHDRDQNGMRRSAINNLSS